jgi:hypothetical protein
VATCNHWDIFTAAVVEARKTKRDALREQVGCIPLTVLPVCCTADQYKDAVRDRKMRKVGGTIKQNQEYLNTFCTSIRGDGDETDHMHVNNASVPVLRKNLKDRKMPSTFRDTAVLAAAHRQLLKDRLELERDLQCMERECECPNFDYTKTNSLMRNPLRVILCILHAENRMSEKILTRLFQWALTHCKKNKENGWATIKTGVAHIHLYALRGSSWSVDADDENDLLVKDIKLSKAHCRKILCKEAWESGHVRTLIDILVGDSPEKPFILCHVEKYITCIHMMARGRISSRSDILKFQEEADICCKSMMAVWTVTSMTNYFHCLFAGHFRDLMLRWGDLLTWSNEGVEAFNGVMKSKFYRGTQKGGSQGTHGGTSSKALGLGNWMLRRWLWLCGKARPLFDKKSETEEAALGQELIDEAALYSDPSSFDSDLAFDDNDEEEEEEE